MKKLALIALVLFSQVSFAAGRVKRIKNFEEIYASLYTATQESSTADQKALADQEKARQERAKAGNNIFNGRYSFSNGNLNEINQYFESRKHLLPKYGDPKELTDGAKAALIGLVTEFCTPYVQTLLQTSPITPADSAIDGNGQPLEMKEDLTFITRIINDFLQRDATPEEVTRLAYKPQIAPAADQAAAQQAGQMPEQKDTSRMSKREREEYEQNLRVQQARADQQAILQRFAADQLRAQKTQNTNRLRALSVCVKVGISDEFLTKK